MKEKLAAGELVLCMNLRLARSIDIAMVAKAGGVTRSMSICSCALFDRDDGDDLRRRDRHHSAGAGAEP